MKTKNIKKKKTSLEVRVINCNHCYRPTKHLFIGNYGTNIDPVYVYKCNNCWGKYFTNERVE